MKKALAVLALALLGGFLGAKIETVHAQTAQVPFSFSVTGTHTSCPVVVASTTQYCFPTDGPYLSLNGAAWQALPLTAGSSGGVTGIVVCNVSGSTCSTTQTGAVTLNIPKTATVPSTAATLN